MTENITFLVLYLRIERIFLNLLKLSSHQAKTSSWTVWIGSESIWILMLALKLALTLMLMLGVNVTIEINVLLPCINTSIDARVYLEGPFTLYDFF